MSISMQRWSRWILGFCAAALAAISLVPAAEAGETLKPIYQRYADAGVKEEPSFQRHVLPMMGRLGCNGRACHGSFQGRGGFRLSLFGYDFEADHEAMASGDDPRVDLKTPADSLIIQKPTSDDEHEGGQRYEKGSWEHHVFRRWIECGAKNDGLSVGKLVHLEVTPSEIIFQKDGKRTQLRAVAHWDDGTSEDVTPICRFKTNDASVASINETGEVTAGATGDTHVVVFYDNGITTVPVLRAVSDKVADKYPQVPTPTKVDELVVAKLSKLGIVPSDLCTDAEFLRRASLDMTGTLPTPDEVLAFLADDSPNKRSEKIDELLSRPTYAAWWATKLCDITGNNAQNGGNNSFRNQESRQWYQWIYHRLDKNVPYDEIVEGIVTATGRRQDQSFEDFCKENTRYYRSEDAVDYGEHHSMPHFWSRRTVRQPEEKALSFAYAFLGVRLQCAQCHKHPFDQWSKKEFEQFKNFFTAIQFGTRKEDKQDFTKMTDKLGLKGKKGGDLRKMLPKLLNQGKTIPWQELYVSFDRVAARRKPSKSKGRAKTPPVRTVKATLLGGEQLEFKPGDDPREALMDWMRRKDNRFFAQSFVNRVWASYFNVGIIQPPDDLNLANPPSNAPLLEWLTSQFVERDYDIKWLHRTIVGSRTYQLSWKSNETNRLDTRNFSRAVPRRLPAEVIYDALTQATASDQDLVSRQTDLDRRMIGPQSGYRNNSARGAAYALATFGKPMRMTNCDCERSLDPSLLQTLYLRNDRETLALISARGGWIDQLARQKGGDVDAAELIRSVYLRTISREPTEAEMKRVGEHMDQADTQAKGLRDVLWALLNTKEFIVNH